MSSANRFAFWIGRLRPGAEIAVMVGAAALAAHLGERWLDPQSLALFFVVPIVLAAMSYGLRAALAASVLGVAAVNFLFVEPRYTLAVARMQDLGALVLFAVVGVLVSFIADRARAAEVARLEAARERSKAELLGGVSHDLRTPLATIVFTLQSLRQFANQHDAEARSELVSLAEAEARRLASMVDALLSASRLEAGKTPVQIEPASIDDTITAAVEGARERHGGLQIVRAASAELPLIAADTALATTALTNVISNAAKYGGATAVEIATRCDAHYVVVEVSDRGPGLGDDPDRLFEKFVRGVESDGREPGLGLGLAIARRFMEIQGGSLTASNREGGGAVFTFAFPCWTKAVRDAS